MQGRRAPSRLRTEAIGRWAIWLAVLSSVVLLPGALNRWVLPKDLVLVAACVLAAVVAARAAPAGRVPRWLWTMIAVAAVVLCAAAMVSDAPLAQLFGRWPRYEGLITLPVYVGALWFGASMLGTRAVGDRAATFVAAITGASLALGVVSLLEAVGVQLIATSSARPGALLGNATDQGIVAAMFFAVLVMPVVRSWIAPDEPTAKPARGRTPQAVTARPWWPLAGVVSAVLTIVISASRAAFVAAALVVIGMVVLEVVRRRLRSAVARATLATGRPSPAVVSARRVRLIALAVAVAGAGVILLAFPLMARRVLGLTPLASATIDDRLAIYSTAWDLARDNLLLGVGPSGFVAAIPHYFDADWYTTVGADTTLDSPHNWVLQAFVAGGVPLLSVALGLAVTAAVIGVRRWRASVAEDFGTASVTGSARADLLAHADLLAGAGLAVVAFGVALLTHFTAPGTTILAAMLLGTLLAVPPRPAASSLAPAGSSLRPARSPLRLAARTILTRARPVLFGVWLLVLVLATSAEFSLAAGVKQAAAGDIGGADSSFSTAVGLRPWDADVASIAAESMAQAAEAQMPGAAELATTYARRALSVTPDSVLASKALAVGQQYSGELEDARATLDALHKHVPLDGVVVQRLGGISVLLGDYTTAEDQLLLAVDLLPDDPAPWQTLEYLYQQTGDSAAEASAREQINALSSAQ